MKMLWFTFSTFYCYFSKARESNAAFTYPHGIQLETMNYFYFATKLTVALRLVNQSSGGNMNI